MEKPVKINGCSSSSKVKVKLKKLKFWLNISGKNSSEVKEF